MPSIHHKATLKTESELGIMKEGGSKLAHVKNELKKLVKEGVSAFQIEELATELIEKLGGAPSFKMVPGYYWTTCVNIGSGLVHGIPKKEIVFKKDDLVSVDLGMLYKGFHTDTSFSKLIGENSELKSFMDVGKKALLNAIKRATCGNRIGDISEAIQTTIEDAGLTTIKRLVGHGIGKNLHEEPEIPCFIRGRKSDTPEILSGMALAIEVMYTEGKGDIKILTDGWTITTADDKISALFEETITVTEKGTEVITA